MTAALGSKWLLSPSPNAESKNKQWFSPKKLGIFLDSGGDGRGALHFERKGQAFGVCTCKSVNMKPVSSGKAMEKWRTVCLDERMEEEKSGGSLKEFESLKSKNGSSGVSDQDTICSTKTWILYKNTVDGIDKRNNRLMISNVGQSTNIVWHECLVGKHDRQKLLQQKGCVIWITGLSGSGKSTVACALSHALYNRGKLAYVLDGDNIRHGLNRDLSFRPEDRAENIRRIGEVAKLFADAGVICIASLISPYRRDRDACRALLPDKTFIEVFMDVPLHVCEARDPKGLYKLARAGKIEGFTGIDDPYEPPLNCEISITARDGNCSSPVDMAEQVISFLEENGFLQA